MRGDLSLHIVFERSFKFSSKKDIFQETSLLNFTEKCYLNIEAKYNLHSKSTITIVNPRSTEKRAISCKPRKQKNREPVQPENN